MFNTKINSKVILMLILVQMLWLYKVFLLLWPGKTASEFHFLYPLIASLFTLGSNRFFKFLLSFCLQLVISHIFILLWHLSFSSGTLGCSVTIHSHIKSNQ